MLEVTKKRTVKTRKKHECYGCTKTIDKGVAAVHVSGKEDGHYRSLYLHVHCHISVMKKKLFDEGLTKGALLQIQNEDYSIDKDACPF